MFAILVKFLDVSHYGKVLREVATLSRLQHQHVVRYYQVNAFCMSSVSYSWPFHSKYYFIDNQVYYIISHHNCVTDILVIGFFEPNHAMIFLDFWELFFMVHLSRLPSNSIEEIVTKKVKSKFWILAASIYSASYMNTSLLFANPE